MKVKNTDVWFGIGYRAALRDLITAHEKVGRDGLYQWILDNAEDVDAARFAASLTERHNTNPETQ